MTAAMIRPAESASTEPAAGIRESAREFSPDPFPDVPPSSPGQTWWYAPGEFEAGALHQLVTTSRAAARHCAFADNYRRPDGFLSVALRIRSGDADVVVHSNGGLTSKTGVVEPDGTLRVPPEAAGEFRFTIQAPGGQPATFTVTRGEDRLQTSPALVDVRGGRLPLQPRTGGRRPAHAEPEPVVSVPLAEQDGLHVAPAELLGRIVAQASHPPTFATGESRQEAQFARGVDQEGVHTVVQHGPGRWSSEHALALRYLVAEGVEAEVQVDAHIRPVPRRGAFVCSDPVLSRIWGTAAYTLRACMQRLVVDGLKRDRMPWIGDQAISVLANAFAFGDSTIAYDSHLALGSPQGGYVNGISDYSLWWLITADLLDTYFPGGGPGELAGPVLRFLDTLTPHVDERGLFAPVTLPGFHTGNPGSVLIDWGYDLPDGVASTALQMLWVWALQAGAAVLGRAGETLPAPYQRLRDHTLAVLRRDAWSSEHRAWRRFVDGTSAPDPHANFLAVAAGITDPLTAPGVTAAFEAARGRTPYLQTVSLRALLAAGRRQQVLDDVRRFWGEELELGATTFWEEFPEPGESWLAMYGRPYARSLCHAWGAGPAALLPEAIFGLRILEPGWIRFDVDPDLCGLDWAALVIPAAVGDITLTLRPGQLTCDLPDGCVAVMQGQEVRGMAPL